MIYVKSIFAGLAAVIVTSIVLVIVLVIWLSVTTREQVGIDVISVVKWPVAWIYVSVLFGLGFGWEFRRQAK
jgi:TRAP-type C4-dicarboxylate transport system permease small subunit